MKQTEITGLKDVENILKSLFKTVYFIPKDRTKFCDKLTIQIKNNWIVEQDKDILKRVIDFTRSTDDLVYYHNTTEEEVLKAANQCLSYLGEYTIYNGYKGLNTLKNRCWYYIEKIDRIEEILDEKI